jgi:hypothetical protein
MWWALTLLGGLAVLRMLALGLLPPPPEYDPIFRMAPVRNPWGPSWASAFFGFLGDYSDPVQRAGYFLPALGFEFATLFVFLLCVHEAWNGKSIGMGLAFAIGIGETLALGCIAGLPWAVVQLFPTLMVGLGWSNGPAPDDD